MGESTSMPISITGRIQFFAILAQKSLFSVDQGPLSAPRSLLYGILLIDLSAAAAGLGSEGLPLVLSSQQTSLGQLLQAAPLCFCPGRRGTAGTTTTPLHRVQERTWAP